MSYLAFNANGGAIRDPYDAYVDGWKPASFKQRGRAGLVIYISPDGIHLVWEPANPEVGHGTWHRIWPLIQSWLFDV